MYEPFRIVKFLLRNFSYLNVKIILRRSEFEIFAHRLELFSTNRLKNATFKTNGYQPIFFIKTILT